MCYQLCVVSKEKGLCEGISFFCKKVLFRSKRYEAVTRLDSKESFWATKVEMTASTPEQISSIFLSDERSRPHYTSRIHQRD